MRMLVVRMLCREEIQARKSKENQGKPRKTKASNFKKYFEHVFVGFGRGDAYFLGELFTMHSSFELGGQMCPNTRFTFFRAIGLSRQHCPPCL